MDQLASNPAVLRKQGFARNLWAAEQPRIKILFLGGITLNKTKHFLIALLFVLTVTGGPFLLLTGCGATHNEDLVKAYKNLASDYRSGYKNAIFEGAGQGGESFLACGTNGRLDRIYADKTVENIPIDVDGKELTQIYTDSNITLVSGLSGVLLYSRDNREFSPCSGINDASITGLTNFKGAYYACTLDGSILKSSDGISWKLNANLIEKSLIAIASNENNLMAITSDTDIFVTEDAENWTSENFNKTYEGLYEKYTFTNLVTVDYPFYILGYSTENPDTPLVIYSDSAGEVWLFESFTEINKMPIDEHLPLRLNSLTYCFEGQALAPCNNGRVFTLTTCFKCHLISDVADVDLRAISVGDNTMLAVGDDFEFVVLTSASLRQNEISAEQAFLDSSMNGAVIIDVRSDEEYKEGHILGAKHIPVDVIEAKLPALVADKNMELIFYCAAGARAQTALETAQKLGYENVYNLGGLSDWPYEIES